MFVPQDQPQATTFGTSLNPEASTFTPKFGQSIATSKTIESSAFGQPTSTSTFGKPSTGFASSGFGGFGSSPVPVDSPFGKPSPAPRPPTQQNRGPSSFGGFTTSVEAAADKGKDAIPENSTPSIAAEQKSVFGSLGGLGMGKAAALTQTSSPSPSISTTTVSGVPPIFGQNAPSQAGFSFTKPAEGMFPRCGRSALSRKRWWANGECRCSFNDQTWRLTTANILHKLLTTTFRPLKTKIKRGYASTTGREQHPFILSLTGSIVRIPTTTSFTTSIHKAGDIITALYSWVLFPICSETNPVARPTLVWHATYNSI